MDRIAVERAGIEMMTPPPGPTSAARSLRRMSRRRLVLASAIALFVFAVIGLAIVELSLPWIVRVTDLPVRFWDPATGPRTSPGQSGRWVIQPDIDTPFQYNVQGWNFPKDFEVTRPQRCGRVCIVGDSQVESLQVPAEEAMYSVAERAMSGPDRPMQWYPFGNSGFGTSQELEVIRHYVLDYQPDFVILFFVPNDPFDCSPYLVSMEPNIPIYYLDESDRLRLSPPGYWAPSLRGRLAVRSSLFRYFVVQKSVMSMIRGTPRVRSVGGNRLREEAEFNQETRVPGLKGLTLAERQKRTWRLIEEMLRRMRDECRARGAEFGLAYRGIQTEIDAPLIGLPSRVPAKDVDPYCLDSRVSEMGREQLQPMSRRLGIPYLDLTEPLQEAVRKSGKSHRFGFDEHYNPMAHEAAGKALAAWVEAMWDRSAVKSPIRIAR